MSKLTRLYVYINYVCFLHTNHNLNKAREKNKNKRTVKGGT